MEHHGYISTLNQNILCSGIQDGKDGLKLMKYDDNKVKFTLLP